MKKWMLALTLFMSSVAEAADLAQVIDLVEARYGAVTALKARFTQITRSSAFGEERASGELVLKRPGKMRWNFGDKLFVTDGKKLWIYTPSAKQVIQYDDVTSSSAGAERVLQQLDRIEEHFNVRLVSSDATSHVLEISPKGGQGDFKKARLTFAAGDTNIKQVVITDTFDGVTEINFTEVQLNARADDSLFTFTAPAGVEVIRGSGR